MVKSIEKNSMNSFLSINIAFFSSFLFDIFMIAILFSFLSIDSPLSLNWSTIIVGIVVSTCIIVTRSHLSRLLLIVLIGGCITTFGIVLFHWPLWLATVLLPVFYWRSLTSLRQEDADVISSSRFMFYMVLTFLVFIGQLIFNITSIEEIMIFLLLGLLVYSGGTHLYRCAKVSEEKASSKHTVVPFVGVITAFTSIMILFYFSGSTLRSAFYKLIDVFFLIASPISYLSPIFNDLYIVEKDEQESPNETQELVIDHTGVVESTNSDFSWILILFTIVGCLILVLLLVKNKDVFKKKIDENELIYNGYLSTNTAHGIVTSPKQQTPNNELRKIILRFEKRLAKKGQGRLRHESIREWLSRINLNATEGFLQSYEKIRYGHQEVSKKHYDLCKSEVKQLEQKAKEIRNRN